MDPIYIYQLIFLFFTYSLAGWIIEVTLKYFQYHRFINRGFLIGPYCPIYGAGAVLVTVLSELLAPYDSSYGTSFLLSFFFCGVLEYLTSLLLENRFHARWWDYSQKPMNLHGRVWIGNLILFGLGGMAIDKIFNPFLFSYLHFLSLKEIRATSLVIVLLMGTDYLVSHFVIQLLKEGIERSEADQSETIAKEVRYLLENKSVLHRRLINAYPELTFRTERVKARLERIRRNTENLRLLANNKLDSISDHLEETYETMEKNLVSTRSLQRRIIDLQDELIQALLAENLTDQEKDRLLKELGEEKELLKKRDDHNLSKLLSNGLE